MAVSTSTANVFRIRTAVLGLAKAMFFGFAAAAPTSIVTPRDHHDNVPEVEGGPLWILFIISMVLVLAGGAFAGLTIALMGQDEIYLQVLSTDPEEPQRKNAKRVLDLLKRGKHWVLVTLLLSNVIVNETLPVVLDRCFGGGVAAVVGSTVLIGMHLFQTIQSVNRCTQARQLCRGFFFFFTLTPSSPSSHLRRGPAAIRLCALWLTDRRLCI